MKESWKESYAALLTDIEALGYPEEFAKEIAKNLGSEKTMDRMRAYLAAARPGSAEEIVDEMLAICSDRERWIQKKEAEYYQGRYNELLRYGLGPEREG